MSDSEYHHNLGLLEISSKKLAPKPSTAQSTSKSSATIRQSNERSDLVLRADLSTNQPALKLAHYAKPNYVTTQNGLHPQTLLAQKDLTNHRYHRAYSDSESENPPALAIDVHKIFDFSPKTPQDADIQQRVNSVPSLKQLNDLRKYKMGIHPDKKFRMMLNTSQGRADATTQFVKDYIIETDKEKRSIPLVDGMNVQLKKPEMITVSSPISSSRAVSAGRRDKSLTGDCAMVKPSPKYGSSIRLMPMTVEITSKSKNGAETSSLASLNTVSTDKSSPIYSPATFRVPKTVDQENLQPYDMYASKDMGPASLLMLSSAEDMAAGNTSSSSRLLQHELPTETASRLLAMQDSDSFQDIRREQFLQDSLAEEASSVRSDNTHSLIDQIRVTDMPGRSRIPKKYGHFIEELDANNEAANYSNNHHHHHSRPYSRQQRLIRSSSPAQRERERAEDEEGYESLRRTGTSAGNKLKCSKCYVQAVLWCSTCIEAYCLACWNTIAHHSLYNMVPAFPAQLTQRFKQKFQKVIQESSVKYLDPAPAITTGKREFERPPPNLVRIPSSLLSPPGTAGVGKRPRSSNNNNNQFQSESSNKNNLQTTNPKKTINILRLSSPDSPIHDSAENAAVALSSPSRPIDYNDDDDEEEGGGEGGRGGIVAENDKSFSPKVLFASKKAARTAAAAQEIEEQLHRAMDRHRVYDGNALPAKMPVVNQPSVVYQDYTIPGVVLNGKGQILEITDECSEHELMLLSPTYHKQQSNSRPGTTGTGTGGRLLTASAAAHERKQHNTSSSSSGNINRNHHSNNNVFLEGDPNFQGEVRNAVHYIAPSRVNTASMTPLGMQPNNNNTSAAAQVVVDAGVQPSGFDNSSPHRELVRKITREGARNLQRKGDTRTFSPSFSLGGLGNSNNGTNTAAGGAAAAGGTSASANIAATISRPSTVARPMTGIVKEIVFPSTGAASSSTTHGKEAHLGNTNGQTAASKAISMGFVAGDGKTTWKDGEFDTKNKTTAEPKRNMNIYDGVAVYLKESKPAEKMVDPLETFANKKKSTKPKTNALAGSTSAPALTKVV